MSVSLYEHNRTAYNNAVLMISECGKAAVIHPTGTGKSFIAFKLCEDNKDKRVLWLSPSEYIFKTQIENVKKVSPDFEAENITFMTYSRLMLLTVSEVEEIKVDYIILDEFHRLGALKWGEGVERLLSTHTKAKILGLSATNIRYLDNQRDMAEEIFEGNIASEITLGDAIVRGILAAPTYIVSMYSYQKELERYRRRLKNDRYKSVRSKAEKYLENLRRALERADGVETVFQKHMSDKSGKYIIFCANREHMEEMISLAPGWFSGINEKQNIYKVYSEDPAASKDFAAFKQDESECLKLLYCIDMLNEGIHVENVSGVILLRPTVSPIVYKQQIGRALSAAQSKNPIIFDVVNNFENLYSISAIENEIRVAMTYYHNLDVANVKERFKIIDEVRECRELFSQLEDTLTISWDTMYLCAKAYFEKNGNLDVPKRYKTEEGYSLGNWICTQRKVYAGIQYGRLDRARIDKLNAIGMRWERMSDVSWEKFYTEAKRYYMEAGDLNTNVNYVSTDGYPLGKRICQMRTYRKSNIKTAFLTAERISMLDKIGMIWSVPDYIWEQNYMAALEYFRNNGHLDVPSGYISQNGVKLGVWIKNLRNMRISRHLTLSTEQITKLENIGMLWENKYERQWNKGYGEASEYYEKNNNLNVPVSYISPSGFKLGEWIANQREAAYKMKPERRKKLDSIGMVWKKSDPWETRFSLAEKYFNENGHLNVPAGYITEGVWLNKWLNEQKHIFYGRREGKSLSESRIKRLESIGIQWKIKGGKLPDEQINKLFEVRVNQ